MIFLAKYDVILQKMLFWQKLMFFTVSVCLRYEEQRVSESALYVNYRSPHVKEKKQTDIQTDERKGKKWTENKLIKEKTNKETRKVKYKMGK
jgi:hypothetical protein